MIHNDVDIHETNCFHLKKNYFILEIVTLGYHWISVDLKRRWWGIRMQKSEHQRTKDLNREGWWHPTIILSNHHKQYIIYVYKDNNHI